MEYMFVGLLAGFNNLFLQAYPGVGLAAGHLQYAIGGDSRIPRLENAGAAGLSHRFPI